MKHLPLETRVGFYRQLLELAAIDGRSPEDEQKALEWFAAKWDIPEPESLDPAGATVLPDDPDVAAAWLFDTCELSIADEVLSGSEKLMLTDMAARLGFKEAAINVILQGIVTGHQQGLDDDELQEKVSRSALAYRR